ncbi:hypothetical protein [Haloferula sp. A504]|uniref:hypothetical protein n=1 Tax=Haloferula sp. A504 TaxID=3373601 RepID=UPI0031C2135B|nr:hypothetical protein [Verrucomicrobiaceae bacterium E54]
MRYILADNKRSKEAGTAIAKLPVGDVRLEIVNGKEPDSGQSELLSAAEVVYCVSVRKKYRKKLQDHGVSILSFETVGAAIAEIERSEPASQDAPLPSVSLKRFSENGLGGVLFAQDWDRFADEITKGRWRFVMEATSALIDYVKDLSVAQQGMDSYFESRNLTFANNGVVIFSYRVKDNKGAVVVEGSARWHLKEGDKTTPEDAARIYFATKRVAGVLFLILLRVGPHPAKGTICVDVPYPT